MDGLYHIGDAKGINSIHQYHNHELLINRICIGSKEGRIRGNKENGWEFCSFCSRNFVQKYHKLEQYCNLKSQTVIKICLKL